MKKQDKLRKPISTKTKAAVEVVKRNYTRTKVRVADANLSDLRTLNEKVLGAWLKKGKKITKFYCHHCKTLQPARQPDRGDVNSTGIWDSSKICTNCGGLNFVTVFINGRTKSKAVGIGKGGKSVKLTPDQEASVYVYNPGHKMVMVEKQ